MSDATTNLHFSHFLPVSYYSVTLLVDAVFLHPALILQAQAASLLLPFFSLFYTHYLFLGIF